MSTNKDTRETLLGIDRACKDIADRMLAEISSHRFSVEHAIRALKEANIDPDTRCVVVGEGLSPEFVKAVTEAKSRGIVVIDVQREDDDPDATPLEQCEVAWDRNVEWVVKTLDEEENDLKADNGADTTAPIWLQYYGGQFYLHMNAKPAQHGSFGTWAAGAITVASEPAEVADYLIGQITRQLGEK